MDEILKCNHLHDTELPQAPSEHFQVPLFTLFDVIFQAEYRTTWS